jgi:hypothetical protein
MEGLGLGGGAAGFSLRDTETHTRQLKKKNDIIMTID